MRIGGARVRHEGGHPGLLACLELFGVSVAGIRHQLQGLGLQRLLGALGHRDQLVLVRSCLGDGVMDDEPVPGIHRRLHVVTDHRSMRSAQQPAVRVA